MYIIIPSENKGNFKRRNNSLGLFKQTFTYYIIRWNENSSKKPKVSDRKKNSQHKASKRKRFIKDLCYWPLSLCMYFAICYTLSSNQCMCGAIYYELSKGYDTLFPHSVTVYNNYTPISDIFHQVLLCISKCIDVKNYPYAV